MRLKLGVHYREVSNPLQRGLQSITERCPLRVSTLIIVLREERVKERHNIAHKLFIQ
jgi:hypothetical protein